LRDPSGLAKAVAVVRAGSQQAAEQPLAADDAGDDHEAPPLKRDRYADEFMKEER